MASVTETFPHAPEDRRMNRPIKELQMIFGGPGVGKSHMFLTIARWHQILGSPAQFRVVSTDQSYGPLLESDDFRDLENIRVEECDDLDEAVRAAKLFKSQANPGDFTACDRIDHCWSFAQDEYAAALARKEGSTIDDLGDLWKAEGVTGDYPISGWDWGGINGRYRALRNHLISSKAHVVVMADEKELLGTSSSGKTEEDKMVKGTFRHIGHKPTGQKEDPSVFHSLIYVSEAIFGKDGRPEAQMVATAKERWGNRAWLGRRMSNGTSVVPVRMEDYFQEYMVDIGGWETS